MKCHEVEQYLSEYIEGQLTAACRREVQAHLDCCKGCSQLVKDMQTVLNWCDAYPELNPPSTLVDDILGQTSGHFQALSWWDYLKEMFKPLYATPRFAAGTCMAVISFALVLNALGVRWSQIRSVQWANLTPKSFVQSVNRSVYLAYDNGVRRLNDLKILYQIQSKLDEFRTQPIEKKETPQEKPKESPKSNEHSAVENMIARRDLYPALCATARVSPLLILSLAARSADGQSEESETRQMRCSLWRHAQKDMKSRKLQIIT